MVGPVTGPTTTDVAHQWSRSCLMHPCPSIRRETHLQATAGSQRHFSLVKVLLWVQIRPLSGECRLKTLACRTLFVRQCDNACLDHASACAVESTWSSYLPAGNKISS
jgi:hypothetical protein